MERPDLNIARKVLGVLHNVDELDVHHPDLDLVLNQHGFEDSAIVDYDLTKETKVKLPDALIHLEQSVAQHLSTTDTSAPWGYIDHQIVILKLPNQPHGRKGRLLLFGIEFIACELKKLFPTAAITNAERRVLLQTVAGISLKHAAELDTVSYETKKSQLRSVFQKTQLNSQQALSQFLISHLTMEIAAKISRQPSQAESDEMFFYYADNYMGSYVRASVVQESANKRFRILEFGDPSGTPIVCIHHLGIINFSEEELFHLKRNRLRLICPLRHGALGPADEKISSIEHLEHALAGIDLAVSLTGQKQATILSLLSGCLYGIKYADKNSQKVANLIMLGASYKPPVSKNVTSIFKKNLHDLAAEHERTLEVTVSTMLDNVDQPLKLKNVVLESHNNGAADSTTINALFSDNTQVTAMQHRLRHSPNSIVQDLKMQSVKDWTPLARIADKIDIHFIHGTADDLVPLENIQHLIQTHPAQLHRVEGAGNWIFGDYTEQTASLVRRLVEQTNS